jgi:hypothetical protein
MTQVAASVLNHNYSRRARRIGVLLMYLSYPLISLSGVTWAWWHGAGWALIVLAVIGFFAGGWLTGLRGIRSRIFPYTVGASDAVLDERQREAKYRAYRVSYWILAVLALAALAATIGLGLFALTVPSAWLVFFTISCSAALTLLVVAYSLPYSVIAWSQPDP